MVARILRWLFFTVAFSLLPLLAVYAEKVSKAASWPSLTPVVEHGELYLIAASLSAVGVGEIVGASKRYREMKIICGGIAFLNVFFCSLLFSFISAQAATPNDFLLNKSVWVFLFSSIIATSCIALGGIEDA